MNEDTWVSIVLVLVFVLIGGLFAGTEIALVSLRDSQLKQLEAKGKRGRRLAKLARDPNRYLSAVQIGVTLAGFLSAAYGAATIAPDLAPVFTAIGLSRGAADATAMVLVTLVIAYVSLVFGELVPKRLALQRAASISLAVGPPLDVFASLMRPVIWLLSKSTNGVVRLLGGDPKVTGEAIDSEELRGLVAENEGLDEDERRIVTDVFEAGSRTVTEVMRPRPDVKAFDATLTIIEAASRAADLPHSRYPVFEETIDRVIGFVHVRDMFAALARSGASAGGADATMADIARPILPLPETQLVLPALGRMQREGFHIAVVVDEYGGTAGIVTLEDLVEELVGEIWDEYDDAAGDRAAAPGEPVEVEGGWILEEFAERTGVELAEGPYETVAGYLLAVLGRVPHSGDFVEVDGRRLEVTEVDGWRIARLRLAPAQAREASAGAS